MAYEAQGGLCAVCCRASEDKALAVDHCHETGRVRGLLCSSCNFGLGSFIDDIENLKKAIEYLERT